MRKILGKDLLRLKGISEGRPLIGPRSVNVHLTNACDRKCCFCWYFSPMVIWNKKRCDIDLAVLKILLQDCAEMGVDEINFEGGEVVLYPHIAEVFSLVQNLGMNVAAYTHLAYHRKQLDIIAQAVRLNVNLSAVTAKEYREMHGGDHFQDVVDNLRILRALRKKRGKPVLLVTFIIHKTNYKNIEAFLELMDDIGVDDIQFRLFEATVEMKSLVFSPQSVPRLRDVIARARSAKYKTRNNLSEIYSIVFAKDFMQGRTAIERTARNNDRFFYYHIPGGAKITCYAGWFFSLIDEQGRVVAPCDNIGICIAGNIYEQSFKDIWFDSRKFAQVRQDALHCIDTDRKRWQECRYCGHAPFNREIHELLHPEKGG